MRTLVVFFSFFTCTVPIVQADTPNDKDPFYDLDDEPNGYPNIRIRTGGGKQFWSDEHVFHDWRIQRNAQTGHCRLLDGKNVRHAWGNFPHCLQTLEKIKLEKELPPMEGNAVLVLHGLTRSRSSMQGLCNYLEKHGGYKALNISYASSRNDIARHAESLARLIDGLDGIEEVNFVAHSLGNVVIRHYLGDHSSPDMQPDKRIRRLVMLGPPNQGSTIARRMKENVIFKTVWGASGKELAENWDKLEARLAIPSFEFGIIAGGRGDEKGMNPLIKGDDDLVVAVSETRLAGARDFAVLPVVHTQIMKDKTAQSYALRFLQHGHFLSEEMRRPIAEE